MMMAPDNIYQDDWTQRLKETPPDPLEDIRQEHEGFLSELEGLAVEAICASSFRAAPLTQQRFAIATNDWTTFYAHVVDFQNEHDLHGETLIAIGEASIPQCLTVRHSQAQAEANADELDTPSAGSLPTTKVNQS